MKRRKRNPDAAAKIFKANEEMMNKSGPAYLRWVEGMERAAKRARESVVSSAP